MFKIRPSCGPTLCLDFDGVLHSCASGWKGVDKIPDPPTPDAMRFLFDVRDHFEVSIHSVRSRSLRGRAAMKHWLAWHWLQQIIIPDIDPMDAEPDMETSAWGMHLAEQELKFISWPWFKPAAHVTLDARSLTFDGTWPKLSTLRDFRPWHVAER